MNELEKIKNKIGKWIEVKDELNEMTIEDFDYSTGVVGPILISIVLNVYQSINVGLLMKKKRSQNHFQ